MHPQIVDIPIIQKRNTDNYYYYKEGLGSVVALADKTAVIKNKYIYYAFGGSKSKVELIENCYQYTSRENDKETKLYYYRSRTYNPFIGRFIQKDDFINKILTRDRILAKVLYHPDSDDIINIIILHNNNLYKYTGNPINMNDPMGNFDFTTWGAVKMAYKIWRFILKTLVTDLGETYCRYSGFINDKDYNKCPPEEKDSGTCFYKCDDGTMENEYVSSFLECEMDAYAKGTR